MSGPTLCESRPGPESSISRAAAVPAYRFTRNRSLDYGRNLAVLSTEIVPWEAKGDTATKRPADTGQYNNDASLRVADRLAAQRTEAANSATALGLMAATGRRASVRQTHPDSVERANVEAYEHRV